MLALAVTAAAVAAGGTLSADASRVRSCHAVVDHGVLPPWTRTGFSDPRPRMAHTVARGRGLAALIFGDPLLSPPSKTRSNKILWVSRFASSPQVRDLRLRAQRMRGTRAHRPSGHARRPRRPGAVDHRPPRVGLLARQRLVGASPRPARPLLPPQLTHPISTPGFNTPAGSSSRLAACSTAANGSGRCASYHGRWSRPTAWWWVIVAPWRWRISDAATLSASHVSSSSPRPRGRDDAEVRGAAVGVDVGDAAVQASGRAARLGDRRAASRRARRRSGPERAPTSSRSRTCR